jgi:outer membrane protein insertion porin family
MRKILMVTILVLMGSAAVCAQDRAPKVAVMPFAIHSQESVPKAKQVIEELFSRQLAAEGIGAIDPREVDRNLKAGETVQTDDQARSVGRKVQADFVLFGSFNQIGSSVSLDGKLVDVSGRKQTEPVFAEEKGMENLAAAVNTVVQRMAVHVLSKAIIAEVKVRGNDRVEADAVKLNAKSKKGELLRPEQVSEDIKAIYKTGFFEKVEAEVSDSPAGKILTFVVQENPTIQEVNITGNKKIKDKDILAAIGTKPFTVLQRNVVSEDVQKIIKLYHQKAYFNVDVKGNVEFPKDPRKATIVFAIKENEKVFIKKISFQGNTHYSSRKLRGVMETKEKFFVLSMFTERGTLQKDILNTDVDRLTVFYHDKGYMDAKVGTPTVDLRDDGFHITIPIEEGSRYKVKDVKVAGDTLDDMKKITKKLEIEKSDNFSREKLRHDLDHISKTYMNEGFAYVEVTPEVKKNPEENTADVTYSIDKKEEVHIGRIYISGNTKTRDKVIRRELKLSEGDSFNGSKLEKSVLNLKKLDYFEDVEIVPSKTDQKGVMDLHIKVKEKLTGSVSVGGGFSSDDGLFTTGTVVQRNLFGRGETLGVKAYLGQDASRYVLGFTEPYFLDTSLGVGADVYNWLREYNDFTKDAVGFKLRTGYPIGNYTRINSGYIFENADISDVTGDAEHLPGLEPGRHIKSSVYTGAERDTTDHPFLPTKGTVNSATVEYTAPFMGSDMNFVKTELRSSVFVPLFWKFVGYARGEFGYIWAMDGEDNVEAYERFFLGGINSLRGFNWGDVGPVTKVTVRDEEGRPSKEDVIVGGLKYGLATFELLFPVVESMGIRGVVFYDAGNAFSQDAAFDVMDFRTDAGVGLRWNSPLGPLRIEWGYNLDPRGDEDQYQWQFSAGAYF